MTFTQKMQERARGECHHHKSDVTQSGHMLKLDPGFLDILIAQTIADTCAEIEGRLMGKQDAFQEAEFIIIRKLQDIGHLEDKK